jgi:nucleotide-binding universal stress UspA family protein
MSANTKKIIVGTDFSDSSAVALYHAINLAERLKAQLHIVHITQASLTVPTDLGMNVPPELEEAKQARERLERMRAMISGGGNLEVELHLRVGQPVTEMLELIREVRPEMVVLGSHGRSAVMRMLLGSVSTELMRRSPVPVLVVPAPGREAELDARPKAEVEPPPADAGMPAVGQAPAPDTHENINFSIGSASAVGTAPAGTSGYDVNPELRVRY